jgi:hypothetical protein
MISFAGWVWVNTDAIALPIHGATWYAGRQTENVTSAAKRGPSVRDEDAGTRGSGARKRGPETLTDCDINGKHTGRLHLMLNPKTAMNHALALPMVVLPCSDEV